MTRVVVVAVLRRNVSREERIALENTFPECDLEFHRLDSRDYKEHLTLCRNLKPDVVLLPLERPIPSAAMKEGFVHVAFIPGVGLKELLPLHPQFKTFEPS